MTRFCDHLGTDCASPLICDRAEACFQVFLYPAEPRRPVRAAFSNSYPDALDASRPGSMSQYFYEMHQRALERLAQQDWRETAGGDCWSEPPSEAMRAMERAKRTQPIVPSQAELEARAKLGITEQTIAWANNFHGYSDTTQLGDEAMAIVKAELEALAFEQNLKRDLYSTMLDETGPGLEPPDLPAVPPQDSGEQVFTLVDWLELIAPSDEYDPWYVA